MARWWYKHIVQHRLIVLMLAAAMVLGSTSSPCGDSGSTCAMAWVGQPDCCRAKPGIAIPPCCAGKQQVRNAVALKTDRSVQDRLRTSAAPLAQGAVAPTGLRWIVAQQCSDGCAAPPGGTLLAQHTSLLL